MCFVPSYSWSQVSLTLGPVIVANNKSWMPEVKAYTIGLHEAGHQKKETVDEVGVGEHPVRYWRRSFKDGGSIDVYNQIISCKTHSRKSKGIGFFMRTILSLGRSLLGFARTLPACICTPLPSWKHLIQFFTEDLRTPTYLIISLVW